MSAPDPNSLLELWFGALSNGFADDAHRQRWFNGGEAFDELLRARFADLPEAAANGALDEWLAAPQSRLAYILATDQLPRNLFRGSARAFAFDHLALTAAAEGVHQGMDTQLGYDERTFFYLPFEHSEALSHQDRCVELFTQLRDDTPEGHRHITGGTLRHAHQHRDIIRRFGRFPHRNRALGRESTAEEATFAAGGSYGQ